jgi:hypothetical protein
MRRVWQEASSSAEYDDPLDGGTSFAEGTMVVDDEVDEAEASKVEGVAVPWSPVDDEGERYGRSGRVLWGSR